jgi:hypothetical protein
LRVETETNLKTKKKMKKIRFYNPLNKVIAVTEVTKEQYDTLINFGMIAEFQWKEIEYSKCLIDIEASNLI